MSAQSGHKAHTPLLHPQRAVHTLLVQAAAGYEDLLGQAPQGRPTQPLWNRAPHQSQRCRRKSGFQNGPRPNSTATAICLRAVAARVSPPMDR